MIIVYFEDNLHISSTEIAKFEDESAYSACLSALERWAKTNRGIITDSEE